MPSATILREVAVLKLAPGPLAQYQVDKLVPFITKYLYGDFLADNEFLLEQPREVRYSGELIAVGGNNNIAGLNSRLVSRSVNNGVLDHHTLSDGQPNLGGYFGN